MTLPTARTVFLSLRDVDKLGCLDLARGLEEMGFALLATGNRDVLKKQGLRFADRKVREAAPHCVDKITLVYLHMSLTRQVEKKVCETASRFGGVALTRGIAYYTTVAGACAALQGIQASKESAVAFFFLYREPACFAV